jgi:NAD(P)H-nitrite reductase large subunit
MAVPMHHLILGNGPAGVVAAETLRKHSPNDAITLVGDEPEPPYSRMAIPYLLEGKISVPGTYLRDAGEHFRKHGIKLIHCHARTVATKAQRVLLDGGGILTYDRLLLATGSRPIRPPISGIERPEVLSCWTLADARAIMAATKAGSHVLQMGAGFIGCIIMEALAARGRLTVVEMGDRAVPRMMTPAASAMIKRWCERQGVEILTSTRVTAIEGPSKPGALSLFLHRIRYGSRVGRGGGKGVRVHFSNGQAREFDVIICATGVKPKIAYLEGSGIQTGSGGGILVDERMMTNVPGVYAAGDCTESIEFATGQRLVNAIQPDAADQALIAALNMCGRQTKSQGSLLMNVLDTFGLVSSSYGQWEGVPGGEHIELIDNENFKYLRLEFNGNYLIGATCVGLTEHVGVLRGLIQGKVRLTPQWKAMLLKDPHKFVDAYLACAQAGA